MSGTGDKGYISGNGQITQIPPGDRGEPIALTGEDLDGAPVSLEELRGRVVVVNVWGSWCVDCRAEMPDLVAAATDPGTDASFLGINVRDPSVANAQSFVRTFEVPFPSVYDPDGKALLAFHGVLGPRTIPSTLVLDRQGRIAASVIGPLPSTLTLTEMVAEVATEDVDG